MLTDIEAGRVFGDLTAKQTKIMTVKKVKARYTLCLCACGREEWVKSKDLLREKISKCGKCSTGVRPGDNILMDCGISLEVIKHHERANVADIRWEDGTNEEKVALPEIINRTRKHPVLRNRRYKDIRIIREAFRTKDDVFYICENEDFVTDIMSLREIIKKG